ncbi:hypothetical protein DH2020_022394 [Rehmannia glutinosa]|uniref:Uncharacterized protein n=1 Tax=Rehmannia glutinosa TaxID=99300 RepID=A0ABR0WGW1_REHGL
MVAAGLTINLKGYLAMAADFDPLDDIFADEAVKNARAVGKFQPKAKFRPTRKESAATSVSTSQAVQTIDSTQSELSEPVGTTKPSENCSDAVPNDNVAWHSFMEKSVGEEEGVLFQFFSSVEDSLTAGEPNVPSSDRRDHMHDSDLGREVMDAMDINMTELITKSGHREGKFQPKPKIQMHKEMREASESVSYSLGSQSVPNEINYAEKDSIPTFEQDDVLDLSSLDFTHNLPTEATSELPLNEEFMNLLEMAQLDSGIHLEEDVPEIPAKLASRRAKTGSSNAHTASAPSPQQQKASPSSQENETGRSLRPRKSKTNFCQLVDEEEDEVLASVELSEEFPLSLAREEENINNEEFQVESESQKKSRRKSEKANDGKEKPARNRKKAKEASDQDAGAKPKKFSHSTRRRRVDKVLLETPEDEIDYHKVPLRDLIVFAEHKERLMKKMRQQQEHQYRNKGNKSHSFLKIDGKSRHMKNRDLGMLGGHGDSSGLYNKDETFISKQGLEYNDEQGSALAEDTTVFFNYQTYMDKTPSTRWSKQDTELFYELASHAVNLRIPTLLPSHHLVSSEVQKEERQHPMRLRDALTNRTKDHSHFEKVIERLKQIAAVEKQYADEDDSIDLTGNEVADEGTSNADDEQPKGEHTQEEEPKGEHIQGEGNEDVANDFNEVQSPMKSDDDEDDFFKWSQYKSDT